MQIIPIEAIPNQEFSVALDDNQWDIAIRYANGAIAVSLTLNGNPIIKNLLAVANMRILPAQYQERGNFAFITLNQEIVDYTKFAVSQQLVYISEAELVDVRTRRSIFIQETDFDTIAALPLRFKPQGYILA